MIMQGKSGLAIYLGPCVIDLGGGEGGIRGIYMFAGGGEGVVPKHIFGISTMKTFDFASGGLF